MFGTLYPSRVGELDGLSPAPVAVVLRQSHASRLAVLAVEQMSPTPICSVSWGGQRAFQWGH